jgi:acetyl-CoA carboxylase carboxyltransferase component
MVHPVSVGVRDAAGGRATAQLADLGGRQVLRVALHLAETEGLTTIDAATIEAGFRTACEKRLPIVTTITTNGVSIDDGFDAVVAWGRAARALAAASGVVPTLFVVDGPMVAGPSLLLGLADLVVFVDGSHAFVSGPAMVESFTGVPISKEGLGGTGTHSRSSGLAALVAGDLDAALELVESVLTHLPDHLDETPPRIETNDPADRPLEEATSTIPDHPTGSYDVRTIVRDLADDGEFLELRSSWAPNLVTGFCSIDGRPVGVVANQSQALAGSIDIPASQKGARFVAWCDAFNVPLLTLVDTSGFLPGKDLEWRGMIRHGAQLAFAYARATVPRVALILRKSYGGAYIVMDSKNMGNDLMLAWPTAEVAVMGAKGAVEILHRTADAEERARLEADYEARFLTPYPTAERGSISQVIDPADTRRTLAAAFEVLATKRERLRPRKHDNSPL